MKRLHDNTGRPRSTRRTDADARPAPVTGPLLTGLVAVATTAVLAGLAGLTVGLIITASAIVAVLVAVGARHTVGALAAGAGLRVAQPYCPGERVRLFVPTLGATVEAEIVRVGPANTTLMTSDGLVVLPNGRMLRQT